MVVEAKITLEEVLWWMGLRDLITIGFRVSEACDKLKGSVVELGRKANGIVDSGGVC